MRQTGGCQEPYCPGVNLLDCPRYGGVTIFEGMKPTRLTSTGTTRRIRGSCSGWNSPWINPCWSWMRSTNIGGGVPAQRLRRGKRPCVLRPADLNPKILSGPYGKERFRAPRPAHPGLPFPNLRERASSPLRARITRWQLSNCTV